MAINAPSKKWTSQKLAVAEAISNRIERRLNLVAIPYLLALGFFIQWWAKSTFGGTEALTVFDAVGLPLSLALMVALGPAMLAMVGVLREIQSRT